MCELSELPIRPMKIVIPDKKLKRALEETTECNKRFGEANAKKIRLRLDALAAANSLGVFWPANSGAERCHELQGSMAGLFSMNLKQPYRLIFKEYVPDGEHEQTKDSNAQEESTDERQR